MASSWEGWRSSWENADDLHDPSFFAEPAEIDYKNPGADLAADELLSCLVSLKENGILSAKHVCTLAYWASHAGAKGEHIDKLGLRPDQNSGRYSSHYDKWAGVDIHQQGYYPVFWGGDFGMSVLDSGQAFLQDCHTRFSEMSCCYAKLQPTSWL